MNTKSDRSKLAVVAASLTLALGVFLAVTVVEAAPPELDGIQAPLTTDSVTVG